MALASRPDGAQPGDVTRRVVILLLFSDQGWSASSQGRGTPRGSDYSFPGTFEPEKAPGSLLSA